MARKKTTRRKKSSLSGAHCVRKTTVYSPTLKKNVKRCAKFSGGTKRKSK